MVGILWGKKRIRNTMNAGIGCLLWIPIIGVCPRFPPGGTAGFVQTNDDDDNVDSVMDLWDDSILFANDDDDLDLLTVNVCVPWPEGRVNIGLQNAYSQSTRAWSDKNHTTRILPDPNGNYTRIYEPVGQQFSLDLYLEALQASGGGHTTDPWVAVRYARKTGPRDYVELPGPDPNASDPYHAWFTMVCVDVDMNDVPDNNPMYGNTAETMPGGFLPVGKIQDLMVKPVAPLDPCDVPDTWPQLTLSVEGETTCVEIYDASMTHISPLPYRFSPDVNQVFYVKGVQPTSDLREVTLVLTHDYTGFKDKINLTVFDTRKVPLGSAANLQTCIIGKVYVPTSQGGLLTLTGAPITLYYTNGGDLSYAVALQILKGQLDANIVSTGNPCEYLVPQNAYGWYYVKIISATPTSISSTFLETGTASKTPWNGWYWPKLDSAGANLYEQTGDYTPLKDYDTVYGTSNRAAEEASYSGGESWEGHCWGWMVASIALDQPAATTKDGVVFNQEEMEGLYTELGEGAGGGIEYVLGNPQSPQIPAGPPTSALGEPIDEWVGDFHRCLNQ